MARSVLVVAAVWAVTAAGLSACDASGSATATATSTPPVVSPTHPARDYAGVDLSAALLAASDLPSGYTIDNQLRSGSTALSTCPEEALALEAYRRDAKATAATALGKSSGQFVVQSLVLTSGDASGVTLGALKDALDRCTTWTIDRATYTLTHKEFDAFGDESVAYRISVDDEVAFAFAMLFIRRANLLMAVQVGSVGTSAPRDAGAIFDTADRKLAAL